MLDARAFRRKITRDLMFNKLKANTLYGISNVFAIVDALEALDRWKAAYGK